MNSAIETAIVNSLKTAFPDSTIYSGLVVQGVKPDDLILNTITDDVTPTWGGYFRSRHSLISVTINSPTSPTAEDELIACLQEVTANGITHYPNSLGIHNHDNLIQVLVDITHNEK